MTAEPLRIPTRCQKTLARECESANSQVEHHGHLLASGRTFPVLLFASVSRHHSLRDCDRRWPYCLGRSLAELG